MLLGSIPDLLRVPQAVAIFMHLGQPDVSASVPRRGQDTGSARRRRSRLPETEGAAKPIFPDGGAEATFCWSVQAEKRIEDTIIETSSRPWLSRPMLLRLALLPAYRSSPRVAPRPATSAQDGIVDGLLATSRIVLRTMARGGRQHASLYDTIGQ